MYAIPLHSQHWNCLARMKMMKYKPHLLSYRVNGCDLTGSIQAGGLTILPGHSLIFLVYKTGRLAPNFHDSMNYRYCI